MFELYPLRDKPSNGVRLGLRVANLDAAVEALRRFNAEIVSVGGKGSDRTVVVRDPDGHEIALHEKDPHDLDPERRE